MPDPLLRPPFSIDKGLPYREGAFNFGTHTADWYFSAGNLFLSDSIARLNDVGLDTLGRLFPPLTESARPLDLFLNTPPRFWLAHSPSGPVLGVFNWSDQAQPIIVPGGLDLLLTHDAATCCSFQV